MWCSHEWKVLKWSIPVSRAALFLKSPYSPDISATAAHFIMSETSHITAAGETSQRDKQAGTGCAWFGVGLNLEKSGFRTSHKKKHSIKTQIFVFHWPISSQYFNRPDGRVWKMKRFRTRRLLPVSTNRKCNISHGLSSGRSSCRRAGTSLQRLFGFWTLYILDSA